MLAGGGKEFETGLISNKFIALRNFLPHISIIRFARIYAT